MDSYVSLLAFICVLVTTAHSTVVHAPIYSHHESIGRSIIRDKGDPKLLFENDFLSHPKKKLSRLLSSDNSRSKGHKVEFWDVGLPGVFSLPAAIGSPPQPCRLLIDLAGNDLFVPNIACDSSLCHDYRHDDRLLFFDSNKSSTYEPTGLRRWSEAAGVVFQGPLANDTFHLAGLSIPDQRFINANDIFPLGWIHLYYEWEGILGLAPRWNTSSTDSSLYGLPSPWMNMVEHSILSNNIIAIDLPHGPLKLWDVMWRSVGEISFGGMNPKYNKSNFTRLPLTNYTDLAWATQANSFAWNNKTFPMQQTFTNFTLAGFDSTAWYLGLPRSWARAILMSIPNIQCALAGCEIPCMQRDEMPSMTFGFGQPGEEEISLTVSPYEYTIELVDEADETHCWFSIESTDHMGYPVDAIVLGMPFMNAFYTVLDLDEREIRLTKPIFHKEDSLNQEL